LSDLGQEEEALACSREALEIRRRLAAARPDRFEPDYAGSLNNLGNRLANLGQIEEGRAAMDQALIIMERLASKRPRVYAEWLIRILLNRNWLDWMMDALRPWPQTEVQISPWREQVPEHRRPPISGDMAFLAGCLLHQGEPLMAQVRMAEVIDVWGGLSVGVRRKLEPGYQIACAYLARYAPTAERTAQAQAVMGAYAAQRRGRLPYVVAETLRRLGCGAFLP
jgi:tetratricopeptide (TPR) repeat protein